MPHSESEMVEAMLSQGDFLVRAPVRWTLLIVSALVGFAVLGLLLAATLQP